jgi:CheY-like chemotaxis protein
MAGVPTSGVRLALVVAMAWTPVAAQKTLTLQEAGARNASAEFRPAHLDEKVRVRGVVNSLAFQFPAYTLLAIEDGSYGAVLKVDGSPSRLDPYRGGDELDIDGTVAVFMGMPVILPSRLAKVGVKPAPVPLEVSIRDLTDFRYLGRLVRTETSVQGIGDTANGSYLSLDAPDRFLAFVPRTAREPNLMRGLTKGELVRVTGIAYQYCSRPPYNRYFQVLVTDQADIVPSPARWIPPPFAFTVATGLVCLIGLSFWARERRLRKQRERLRKTYKLGEEILSSSSAETILKRIGETLPEILDVTGAQIYLHNRAAKTLDSVAAEGESPVSIPLTPPNSEASSAAVWCFQYNAVLAIPDPERSPFAMVNKSAPKSLLFVPMSGQTEVAGVLELDRHDRARVFTDDERELAQHLANQAGAAIRLLEQRTVQEQLFRTEKLAAVGRLISGVVNELRAPLESIDKVASRALSGPLATAVRPELSAIAREARKASDIVERLVSYAAAEQGDARHVEVGALLRTLLDFREGDWKASGIRVRDLITPEPVFVLGSQGQLEQVFLTLLVHAEQALAEAPEKNIAVRTSILAKRLLIEIAFSGPSASGKESETAAVLGVTRSVVAGHGGEVRLIQRNNADPRFEVELPIATKERVAPSAAAPADRPATPSRQLTALVIENEESAQRQLLTVLSSRAFRVVPVDNADKGLELAQRMRFDAAFCSVHAPGLNWVELSERMQSRVGAFVLLSDHFDAELASDFEGDGRFVLTKPVQESEVERVVRALDPPVPAG